MREQLRSTGNAPNGTATRMSETVVSTVRRRFNRAGRALEKAHDKFVKVNDGTLAGTGQFAASLEPGLSTFESTWEAATEVLGSACDVVVRTTAQQYDDLVDLDRRTGG